MTGPVSDTGLVTVKLSTIKHPSVRSSDVALNPHVSAHLKQVQHAVRGDRTDTRARMPATGLSPEKQVRSDQYNAIIL